MGCFASLELEMRILIGCYSDVLTITKYVCEKDLDNV